MFTATSRSSRSGSRAAIRQSDQALPVVFSVDGGPDQDFELLAGIAAEAEFSTSFEPFILVGIKTVDRSKQLTPPMTRLAPERLKENFGDRMVAGGAPKFRDYLSRDVVPWATKRYRTDRKVLTAASLGGLFVLDTFLETPDMFDDYIALKPSLWWRHGRIVDEARAKLGDTARPIVASISHGDEGSANMTAPGFPSSWDVEKHAPKGFKWAFVDRPEARSTGDGAVSWLDAMRTLY